MTLILYISRGAEFCNQTFVPDTIRARVRGPQLVHYTWMHMSGRSGSEDVCPQWWNSWVSEDTTFSPLTEEAVIISWCKNDIKKKQASGLEIKGVSDLFVDLAQSSRSFEGIPVVSSLKHTDERLYSAFRRRCSPFEMVPCLSGCSWGRTHSELLMVVLSRTGSMWWMWSIKVKLRQTFTETLRKDLYFYDV